MKRALLLPLLAAAVPAAFAASVATTVSLNTDGMKEAAKAIPEPSSATLSLLALACLTARRRRR